MILENRIALVTGGGRGIGRAVSLKLGEMGAAVAVNYSKSAKEAEEVVDKLRQMGRNALTVGFDVANEEAVETGVKEVVSKLGGLDILVNNAGIAVDGLLMRTKLEDWQKIMSINMTGCFLVSRAASKSLLRSKSGGRVINISSVIGEMGNAGQSAYAASKSAMFGFTKSLAKELGSRAVTVNAVAPGFIATDMTLEMSEEQKAGLLSAVPLGRLGTVEDVADLVAFLASPQAAYITGEIIAVNGGLHM